MLRNLTSLFLCLPLLVSCSLFDSLEKGNLNKAKQTGIQIKQELSPAFFPRDLNIVAAGDSLTLGVGSHTNAGGYIPHLDKMLEQGKGINKANFLNYGVRGNRADQLLTRLTTKSVISSLEKADIIILTVGGNDLMQVVKDNFSSLELEHFLAEREDFQERLQQIIETARSYNTHAPIILVGLYNPFYNWFANIKEMNEIVDEWNIESQFVLKKVENTYFVDIHDLFINNEEHLLAEDYFHPNDRGYELIAERIYDVLRQEAYGIENLLNE